MGVVNKKPLGYCLSMLDLLLPSFSEWRKNLAWIDLLLPNVSMEAVDLELQKRCSVSTMMQAHALLELPPRHCPWD